MSSTGGPAGLKAGRLRTHLLPQEPGERTVYHATQEREPSHSPGAQAFGSKRNSLFPRTRRDCFLEIKESSRLST